MFSRGNENESARSLHSFSNLLTISQHVLKSPPVYQHKGIVLLESHTEETEQNWIFAIGALSGFVFWKLAFTSEVLSVESRRRILEIVCEQFRYKYFTINLMLEPTITRVCQAASRSLISVFEKDHDLTTCFEAIQKISRYQRGD
jgi:hypothetical protein